MQLHIKDGLGLVDVYFGEWLIPRIQTKLITSIPKYSFEKLNIFLRSEDVKQFTQRFITSRELITFASTKIVCLGTSGNIVIKFDSNAKVHELNNVLLSSLLKIINYGTLSVKGQPIITDTFNFFAENINTYVQQYYNI